MTKRSRLSLFLRIAGALATLSIVFIGVVGYAHTKSGRWLLRYIPGMGACPVGMDVALSPEERDRARTAAADKVRGDTPATTKPALGFDLGQSSRASVNEWTSQKGLACTERRRVELRCTNVAADAVGSTVAADELLFVFDGHDNLVSLGVTRSSMDADAAASLVDSRIDQLVAEFEGTPTTERGERSAAYLEAQTLNQSSAEFVYSDYRAIVSATNMGRGRIVVRETFQLM